MMISAASTVFLAGCDSNGEATANGFGSFDEIEPAATAMQSAYTDANGALLLGITPATASEIPDSGSATYNGFVSGEIAGEARIGELKITAAFAVGNNALTSEARNLYHEIDGAYTGILSGVCVLIESPPVGVPQIQINLDGTLSKGGADYATKIALDGRVIANVSDPTGAVAGTADGSVGGNSSKMGSLRLNVSLKTKLAACAVPLSKGRPLFPWLHPGATCCFKLGEKYIA